MTLLYTAEAYAIKIALLEAQSLNDSTLPVHIFSDSMSVLKFLEAVNDRFQLITDIKTISENLNCSFHWVKAHVGTHSNERADIHAKEAAYKEDVDVSLGTPRSLINLKIGNQILNSWQFRWVNSRQSRFTFGLFPDIDLKRCFGDFFINQILTGHGCFPAHQGRFFGKGSNCMCHTDEGTVSHYIYGCPLYEDIRRSYFPVNFAFLGILDLVQSGHSRKGLIEIVKCVLQVSLEC
ncbi:hypothetical protein AVEN_16664-1 [Araneus ventricosus]|uniref:RNase H type-1 domain-containing protein n=1 Tax=Araneus ventricosus TaxID=182803 RepID=A0A4Y2V1K3_ARAVE|nr:hypothetical protein AVEN_16664-1 [Araneus ventricosus]